MNKKRLGNDPLDDLDILRGPEKKDSKKAGKMTSHPSGDLASQEASQMTSDRAGNMTSQMTGKLTSHGTAVLDIPAKSKLRKMTYYFREDQLKELDKLSKRTWRDKSELARMAIDLLLDSVQKK